jgi:hypothetical protein
VKRDDFLAMKDRRLGKALVAIMSLGDVHSYGKIDDKTEILIELRQLIDLIEIKWNSPTRRNRRGKILKGKPDV